MEVIKVKDGEDGVWFGFWLKVVDLGVIWDYDFDVELWECDVLCVVEGLVFMVFIGIGKVRKWILV